jgi:hypothetical protein
MQKKSPFSKLKDTDASAVIINITDFWVFPSITPLKSFLSHDTTPFLQLSE